MQYIGVGQFLEDVKSARHTAPRINIPDSKGV